MIQPNRTSSRYDFPCLWAGCCVSSFGNALYSAAIGIWVYQQTSSEAWMGIVGATSFFVSFLMEPIAGAIADCLQAKHLLVAADCAQGLIMLLIAALSHQQLLTIECVFLLSILTAGCNAIFSPASSVVLLQIVPSERFAISQSRLKASRGIVTLCASTASASLLLLWGAPVLIAINGVSFLLSACSEAFLSKQPRSSHSNPSTAAQILHTLKDGVHYLAHQHALRFLIFIFCLLNLLSAGFDSILFAWYDSKGFPLMYYGIFLGIQSGASLLSAILFSICSVEKLQPPRLLRLFLGAMFFCYLGMLSSKALPLCIGFLFLFTLGNTAIEMLLQAILFTQIAPQHRGKTLGILNAILSVGTGVSMLLYGTFSHWFHVQTICLIGGCLMALPYSLLIYYNKSYAFSSPKLRP